MAIKRRKGAVVGKTVAKGESQRPPVSRSARQPINQGGRPIVRVYNQGGPGGFDCNDVANCPAVTNLEMRVTNLETAGGEANTASNQGAGEGLFISKVWVDLQFKSLIAGSNVTLTPSATGITIAASGGGMGTDELVKVSSNDTTSGYLLGKLVAGTNIVLTELNDGLNETYEVRTSDSPTFTDLTVTGTVNFNGTTINYDQVTQNFINTPVQISCEATPSFGTPITAPAGTQYAEIVVEYDNGVDPVVTKTIVTLIDGLTQIVPFTTVTDSGEITVSWSSGDVTVAITGGTPGFFSFAAVDALCYYNGVSTNNYDGKIHIHNNDITENNNTTTVNNGVTEVYDNTSTTVHNGTSVFNNIEITGAVIGAVDAKNEFFQAAALQTNFPLTQGTPASKEFIWVTNDSGLTERPDDGAGVSPDEWDYDPIGNQIVFAAGRPLNDIIYVKYIRSIGSISPLTTGQFTWSGGTNTFVVADPNVTPDSMVDVYPKSVPTGNITVVATAGQFTVTTTASDEDGVVFNFKYAQL